MNIQWFPGHMTKALRMMEENIKLVDAIGYVLDARAPLCCLNPQLDKLIGNKPCVFILNKCDLADEEKIRLWRDYFRIRGLPCVEITATASAQANRVVAIFEQVTETLRKKYADKGVFRPTRYMIVGVPNCGKSTIINCLVGKKTVISGDKPGVTKGKQWVRLTRGLELLDTPGTLWPKIDDENVAVRLCFIGSIKDDIVDLYEVAISLLEQLNELYPNRIDDRYGITCAEKSPTDIFSEICLKRGYMLRGAELDTERCAKAVLEDFRKGKFGRITFDLPPVLN